MGKMIIVYCLDKNYIDYARISIASFKHHNPDARIVLVSEKLISEPIGQDESIKMKMPRKFRSRDEHDRITNASYIRLFLTELPYEKIIYVDADTICQKPLDELWNLPCEYINLTEGWAYGKKQAKALGVERYGITGMMVMNLANLRKANFTNICLEVEKNYPTPETGWQHDETCINVAMKDKLTFIDKKYHYCHNRRYDEPIDEKDAFILHYPANEKIAMKKGIRYSSMGNIGRYIYRKRIAIVGNAASLFETKYGPEIDKHEFVIRFNRGFITKPESQGTKTDLVLLATKLTEEELNSYHARFYADRSRHYGNDVRYRIPDRERAVMKSYLGRQPSTGFIAIDMCLYYEAAQIDLYGFDWEETPTFYNPEGYKTDHDYDREKDVVLAYEKAGILKINKKNS